MIRLTIESAAQLRAKAQAGASIAECAREFGVSWSQAKRVAAGENWRGDHKPHPRALDAAKREKIRDLVSAGEKPDWIAYEFGVARSTVSKIKNSKDSPA